MEMIFIMIAVMLGGNDSTNILIRNEVTDKPTYQESLQSCVDFKISERDCQQMVPARAAEWKVPR